nr:aminoglycoside phosphotransferase [Algoriphagus sp.]
MTELSINSPISDLEVLDFWKKGEKILNVLPAGDSNMNLV